MRQYPLLAGIVLSGLAGLQSWPTASIAAMAVASAVVETGRRLLWGRVTGAEPLSPVQLLAVTLFGHALSYAIMYGLGWTVHRIFT